MQDLFFDQFSSFLDVFCIIFGFLFASLSAMRKIYLLLISSLYALLVMANGTAAEGDTITLDRRDGLAESRIRALCQLPDGRMAIATTTTIDLFDGQIVSDVKNEL